MDLTAGPVLACGVLLVVAGVPKLIHPGPTVAALRSVGLRRVGADFVRLLATTEVLVGVGVLVVGNRWTSAAAAAVYAGFCGFLLVALRRPAASCGCTGRRDTPPTKTHVAMNVLFVLAASAAAATGDATSVASAFSADVLQGTVALAYAALAAWLGWVVLTVLPTVSLTGPR